MDVFFKSGKANRKFQEIKKIKIALCNGSMKTKFISVDL